MATSLREKHDFAAAIDPELAREVGVKQFAIWHDRPMIMVALASGKRYAGNAAGMLQATGSYWASVRSAAQPLFHSSRLTSQLLYPLMTSVSALSLFARFLGKHTFPCSSGLRPCLFVGRHCSPYVSSHAA